MSTLPTQTEKDKDLKLLRKLIPYFQFKPKLSATQLKIVDNINENNIKPKLNVNVKDEMKMYRLLDGHGWINDDAVESVLEILKPICRYNAVYIVGPACWAKYENSKFKPESIIKQFDIDTVRKRLSVNYKNKLAGNNIFDLNIIILPLNHGNVHWSTGCFVFYQERIFWIHFDSKPTDERDERLKPVMIKLLQALWLKYSSKMVEMPKVTCYNNIWQYPYQQHDDCGVFMLNNMKLLAHLRNPSDQFNDEVPIYRKVLKYEIFKGELLVGAYDEDRFAVSLFGPKKPKRRKRRKETEEDQKQNNDVNEANKSTQPPQSLTDHIRKQDEMFKNIAENAPSESISIANTISTTAPNSKISQSKDTTDTQPSDATLESNEEDSDLGKGQMNDEDGNESDFDIMIGKDYSPTHNTTAGGEPSPTPRSNLSKKRISSKSSSKSKSSSSSKVIFLYIQNSNMMKSYTIHF